MKEIFYKCDPAKNKECKKRSCFLKGGECEFTFNKECSLDGKRYIYNEKTNKADCIGRFKRG